MAKKSDVIAQKLLNTIEDAIDDFNKAIPDLQLYMYKKIEALLTELDKVDGKIKPSMANIKKIKAINVRLEKLILNNQYINKVTEFGNSFNGVSSVLDEYYTTIEKEYTRPSVISEIKKLAVESTVQSLTESGIRAEVIGTAEEIIRQNIISGVDFFDLNKQVREFMLGVEETPGALSKYSKQITTDTLNQYAASYNKTVTEELGLEWFQYVGALVTASRPLCDALVEKEFVHMSEIPEIVKGKVNGKQIPLNKKTGLPQGMIEGTNKDNFQVLRGGYNCNHLLLPVSKFAVPENIRAKFEKAA